MVQFASLVADCCYASFRLDGIAWIQFPYGAAWRSHRVSSYLLRMLCLLQG